MPGRRAAGRTKSAAKARRQDDGKLEFGLNDSDRSASARRTRGKPPGKRTGRGRRRSGTSGGVRRVMLGIARTLLLLVAVGFLTGVGLVGYYAARLPPMAEWEVPARPPMVRILADNGELITTRGERGEALTLAEMPPYLPQAVIAIEDKRFYWHFGVDPIGLARALFANWTAGGIVEGGSTITQQLAKNLFLEPDRTIERKIQEAVLALWLEARLSKKRILELYLNRVYLGGGAYGVDAASLRYFGKSAKDITLAEAAMLAGLLKAPSRYAPTSDPVAAEARAALVITAMHEQGYIDAREATFAMSAGVHPVAEIAGGSGRYVANWVGDLLPRFVGTLEQDVIVHTTLDLSMQKAAAKTIAGTLAENGAKYGVSQGALVAVDPTGAVKALVGGRDYATSPYNRAVDARRQPGSAFKPFVYLAALEYGLRPETMRIDQPVSVDGWTPENYSKEYRGPVTLQTALALSLNTISVQLTAEVGPSVVADTARRLGISAPLKETPSIALGTSEVSLLDMTGAFVPFANGGQGVIPHIIERITTTDGTVLYERMGSGPGQVVSPLHVAMMNSMLEQTVESGTGHNAAIAGWPAAGKTGTSQNFRDAWFIGYTAKLITGVWMGNDDGSPTKRLTGGSLPAHAWHDFMEKALEGVPAADLPGDYQFRGPPSGRELVAEGRRPGWPPGPGYPPMADAGPVPPAAIGQHRQIGDRVRGFFRSLFGG